MRYPAFIKKGDTIGNVSPSFSVAIDPYRTAYENSRKFWESKGITVSPGPNTYKNDGVGISTDPADCAEELVDSYVNPNLQALISCGGGELMCETISHVDFDRIKNADPKWYMGYSDNTNFTFLLTTICDTASVYGPCAPAFGMEPLHQSVLDAFRVLTGEDLVVHHYDKWEKEDLKEELGPLTPYNCTEPTKMSGFLPSGNGNGYEEADVIDIKGRLVGGCMDCLVNLLGTRFDHVTEFLEKYRDDGFIWFLEACDLNVFEMRRAMWQMNEAGWFRYVKGFLIGRPIAGEEMMNLDRFSAVLPVACAENRVPAILDCNIGHFKPMMPLISGALASVNYRNGNLAIDMGLEI